jgi:hypothetical protein
MAKPTGFLSLGKPTALTEHLVQNNQRISNYQTMGRSIDTRSGGLITSDRSTRRVQIGYLSDGTYGIAVAKVGIDVVTGT